MASNRNLSGCQVFKQASLPEGWDCEPLGTRLELAYGRALREEDRKPGGVDVYGSNGRVGSHDVALVNEPGVLVGRKGTVGAVHYAPRAFWPIDTVYYALPLTNDDQRFLYHLLAYLPLKFLNAATGVPGLSRRDAYALRGAFPRLDEQAAIARILDAVDTALEHTRAAVERARELKRACLQRFFYDALGETAYADRPKRELPTGWALLPTQQLLADDPKNGLSPESSTQPPGVPTFSIAAIRDGRVDLDTRDHLKFARVTEQVAERYRVCRGDVLVVRGNANPDLVGKAGMVDRFPDGCIYPDITMRIAFCSDREPKVSAAYALLAWNHPVVHNQVLRRSKTSNGTLKINSRDVNQIVMPVPPDPVQAELVRSIGSVDALIDALTAVSQAQSRLKKSLMHDLLTGRVRVRDVSEVAAT